MKTIDIKYKMVGNQLHTYTNHTMTVTKWYGLPIDHRVVRYAAYAHSWPSLTELEEADHE